MLKKEEMGSGAGGWARVCDTCRAAASVVYCRADVAYLCAGCDARIHAANRVASRHERVWVCEACESAPAAFTCKADAASLCTTCDNDIHSANPLALRHHRVPVVPISGCLYAPPAEEEEEDDEEKTESWLLVNRGVKNSCNNGYLFGGDEYLDLVEYNSCSADQVGQYSSADQYNNHNCSMSAIGVDLENQVKGSDGSECVVPVQSVQLEMEYNEASKAGFSYAATMSHSVSLSSMDASIVPGSTTMNDVSNSHSRPPKGTIDLFSTPPIQMPAQFTPMDREARVLRYREKRKTRKFEKTIRYASRKAYAETRPRIKGRFVKRTDVEVEVDQMFSSSILAETDYGIVPSF